MSATRKMPSKKPKVTKDDLDQAQTQLMDRAKHLIDQFQDEEAIISANLLAFALTTDASTDFVLGEGINNIVRKARNHIRVNCAKSHEKGMPNYSEDQVKRAFNGTVGGMYDWVLWGGKKLGDSYPSDVKSTVDHLDAHIRGRLGNRNFLEVVWLKTKNRMKKTIRQTMSDDELYQILKTEMEKVAKK